MWRALHKSTRIIGAAVVVDVDQLGKVAEVPRESAIDWQGRKRQSFERGLDPLEQGCPWSSGVVNLKVIGWKPRRASNTKNDDLQDDLLLYHLSYATCGL